MDRLHYNQIKLVEWREQAKETQDSVAETIGVDRQTVYRAETGKVASYDLLCQLCQHYGKSIHELVYETPIPAG